MFADVVEGRANSNKTVCRNNCSLVVFGSICVIGQKSSIQRACARHSDVVLLFVMRQNRKKYASRGVKLSIIRRQILSSPDRRKGFVGAKGSNRAANQKGTRCFRANPSGKKKEVTA